LGRLFSTMVPAARCSTECKPFQQNRTETRGYFEMRRRCGLYISSKPVPRQLASAHVHTQSCESWLYCRSAGVPVTRYDDVGPGRSTDSAFAGAAPLCVTPGTDRARDETRAVETCCTARYEIGIVNVEWLESPKKASNRDRRPRRRPGKRACGMDGRQRDASRMLLAGGT
jgi:hypothetical protein